LIGIAMLVFGLLLTPLVFAQATYTYTGGALLSSSGSSGALSGSFTLPAAIGPNQTVTIAPASALFNIGVYTGSPPLVVSALSVTTDAEGNIESWSLTGSVTFPCSCSELFQSTGYVNGAGTEVFYTVKAYYPTSIDMASTGEGTWTCTACAVTAAVPLATQVAQLQAKVASLQTANTSLTNGYMDASAIVSRQNAALVQLKEEVYALNIEIAQLKR
jgi:hypothetical protein